jgi:transmembrane sensor
MNWNILLKVLTQQATPAEVADVARWLDEDDRHRQLYQSMQAQYRNNTAPLAESTVDAAWAELVRKRHMRNVPVVPLYRRPWAIAASLLFIAGVSAALWYNLRPASFHEGKIYTASLDREKVILPDSSIVWLNRNSRIVVDEHYNKDYRRMQLQGEAFFEVTHNRAVPFQVLTGDFTVQVHGTSFNVYNVLRDSVADVTVATGLVEVTGEHFDEFLRPQQRLGLRKRSGRVAVEHGLAAHADFLKTGILEFHQSDVHAIAAMLTRHFGVQVSVQPGNGQPVSFTGQVKDTGLRSVLEGISFATGLRYTQQGQTVILTTP